jgi:hypothetical protein
VQGGEILARAFYGDKLSVNLIKTDEGYLICQNVPIARTGWQDYLGQDLPKIFNEPFAKQVKVYRSPTEVFRPETMASFEGKPVTNLHPPENLDINTASMLLRGHAQNIRSDGDLLLADIVVIDAGLIQEIESNFKREISCGYDCRWEKIGDGEYEQKDIVGNHIAVVKSGRAGPKVSIQDQKTDTTEGGKKRMKISQKILTAMGLKEFLKDAEPHEIAAAMDAMSEQSEPVEKTNDKKVKDAEEHSEKDEEKFFKEILARIEALEAKKAAGEDEEEKEEKEKVADKKVKDKAKDALTALEEEMTNEDCKDDDEEEENKKDDDDEEDEEEKKKATDAELQKIVHDMKPVIMGIADTATRIAVAKQFCTAVRDARGERESSHNAYGRMASVAHKNRAKAMDTNKQENHMNRSIAAVNALAAAGEKMRGGK